MAEGHLAAGVSRVDANFPVVEWGAWTSFTAHACSAQMVLPHDRLGRSCATTDAVDAGPFGPGAGASQRRPFGFAESDRSRQPLTPHLEWQYPGDSAWPVWCALDCRWWHAEANNIGRGRNACGLAVLLA